MIADFRDLLAAFNAHAVRFVVVGAHAMAAHGVIRATGDLDLLVEPTSDNARRVWAALAQFGAPLGTLGIRESDFVKADQVVQLGLPPYRIDLLTAITGVSFADAWRTRQPGSLFDVPIAVLGRDALLRNKRASGRPKDLDDVRALGG